jgi:hypothetical protein
MAVALEDVSDSTHCVGCKGEIANKATAMGVVSGQMDRGVIQPKHIAWYHIECWKPLNDR